VLALDEAQQLRGGVFLFDDGVADVGPVKAADKLPRVLQLQALDDVGARERIGRGGERDARHAGVALVQHGERAVLGAEVVAPLAHAVRLVNGKQAQLPALVQRIEQRQKARRGHPLGRGVQQGDVAAQQALLHASASSPAQGGVEKAASTPASCSAPTWSCISAISGEITTVMPWPAALARNGGIW
jgi:hypothetical protein